MINALSDITNNNNKRLTTNNKNLQKTKIIL